MKRFIFLSSVAATFWSVILTNLLFGAFSFLVNGLGLMSVSTGFVSWAQWMNDAVLMLFAIILVPTFFTTVMLRPKNPEEPRMHRAIFGTLFLLGAITYVVLVYLWMYTSLLDFGTLIDYRLAMVVAFILAAVLCNWNVRRRTLSRETIRTTCVWVGVTLGLQLLMLLFVVGLTSASIAEQASPANVPAEGAVGILLTALYGLTGDLARMVGSYLYAGIPVIALAIVFGATLMRNVQISSDRTGPTPAPVGRAHAKEEQHTIA